MLKRWLCLILACACLLNMGVCAEETPQQAPGMEAFILQTEAVCTFSDVQKTDWFYPYVAYGQTLGLMAGEGNGKFVPQSGISAAETLTLAVRVHEAYFGLTTDKTAQPGETWYAPYVRLARSYGLLLAEPEDYTAPARRDYAAAVLYHALPDSELTQISGVDGLPDVDESDPYYDEILALYRAGILVGSDRFGTFCPGDSVTRAEYAKMLCALVQPELRTGVTLPSGSMDVFAVSAEDPVCSFTDVAKDSWYYSYVAMQEQLGIVKGMGDGTYCPESNLSLAEALTAAVRVCTTYYGMPMPETGADKWYANIVSTAKDLGILTTDYSNYERPATRGEVVQFLYRSLPPKEYSLRNDVNTLPDLNGNSPYWTAVICFYRAGILRGSDEYGTVHADSNITRAELATMLTKLVLPSYRQTFTLETAVVRKLTYGTSGSGKHPLEYYQIGSGENVMVLTFAMHGFEDNFSRDGKELVYLADHLYELLKSDLSLVTDNNWTVYILRCVNPDGLYDGNTNNGPGRCTTYYINGSGKLVYGDGKTGIDMNRCFPYNFKLYSNQRNYNGSGPMKCVEAQALAEFVQKVKGTGHNICIDTHGWFSQIIPSSGKGALYSAFLKYFPGNSYASLYGASGYFASYCAFNLGYDACLFELPGGVYSHEQFLRSGYIGKFESAVTDLLKTDTSSKATREPEIDYQLDGN